MMQFIDFLVEERAQHPDYDDPLRWESLLNGMIGVIGDLAELQLGGIKGLLDRPSVLVVLREAENHESEKLRKLGEWGNRVCIFYFILFYFILFFSSSFSSFFSFPFFPFFVFILIFFFRLWPKLSEAKWKKKKKKKLFHSEGGRRRKERETKPPLPPHPTE